MTNLPTIESLTAMIEATERDYGTTEATGQLVVAWNVLRAAGVTEGEEYDWLDRELASRKGWDMDQAGYLYMV